MTLARRLAAAINATPGQPHRGDWDLAPNTGFERRPEPKPAAVLVPFISRAQRTLLLTRRTAAMRNHAGQVAFPGGRVDPEDDGPVAAALREAEEEVALAPHHVHVIGTTDNYETGTGYSITPVVGIIPPDLPLVPSASEVAALFEVPVEWLLDPANHTMREAEWQGRMRRYYSMDWQGEHIWGATAAMIVNLARRLT